MRARWTWGVGIGWSPGGGRGLEEKLKFGRDRPRLPHSHRTHRCACWLWFCPLLVWRLRWSWRSWGDWMRVKDARWGGRRGSACQVCPAMVMARTVN